MTVSKMDGKLLTMGDQAIYILGTRVFSYNTHLTIWKCSMDQHSAGNVLAEKNAYFAIIIATL